MRRPVRIGNASGFLGDRASALVEMVEGGPVDFVTGDYLAEVTMVVLGKQAGKGSPGYAAAFLRDVEPALATRWAVSRDGRTWTFTLRENARFHDGAPLTAADVVASFQRHLDPQAASSATVWPALLRGRPGVVKEVRAPTPRTVEIRRCACFASTFLRRWLITTSTMLVPGSKL